MHLIESSGVYQPIPTPLEILENVNKLTMNLKDFLISMTKCKTDISVSTKMNAHQFKIKVKLSEINSNMKAAKWVNKYPSE